MKLRKKYFFIAGLSIFLFTGVAYASSQNFLTQAQKYINENCGKKLISNQTALLCYLFNKAQEQDTGISTINATISPIPGEISDLKKKVQDLQNNQPPQPTDFVFLSGVFPATGGTTSPIFDAQGYTKIAFTWNCPVGATPILLETSPDQVLWGVQTIVGNAQQCLDSSVTLNTAGRYYKVVLGGSTNFTSITVNAFGHFFN